MEKKKFYKIRSPLGEGNFRYAHGYGRLSGGVGFLAPEAQRQRMEHWNEAQSEDGLSIDESGNQWPDFLGCGDPQPAFFVAERVVYTFKAEGISFAGYTPAQISESSTVSLASSPPPRYYVVQAEFGIELWFEKMGIAVDAAGEPVLRPLPPSWPPVLKFKLESWNGSDLFSYPRFGSGTGLELVCTERIKEIANREQWKNVKFDPVFAYKG